MLVGQDHLLDSGREFVPLLNPIGDHLPQALWNQAQLCGAIRGGRTHQRLEIPAQLRGLEAQFPFVRREGLVLADFFHEFFLHFR